MFIRNPVLMFFSVFTFSMVEASFAEENDLQNKPSEMRHVILMLADEVSQLNRDRQFALDEVSKAEETLDALNASVFESQKALELAQSAVGALSEEEQEISKRIRELEQQFDTKRANLSSEIAALTRKRDNAAVNLSGLAKDQNSKIQTEELNALREQLEAASKKAATAEEELKAVRSGVSTSAEIERLITELRNERQGLTSEIAELKKQKTSADAELSDVKTRLADATLQENTLSSIGEQKVALSEIENAIEEKSKKLSSLTNELAKQNREVPLLEARLGGLTDAIQQFEAKKIQSEGDLAKYSALVAQSEAQIAAIETAQAEAREVLAGLDADVATRRAMLASAVDEVDTLKTEQAAISTEIEQLRKTRSRIIDDVAAGVAERNGVDAEIVEAKTALDILQQRIGELSTTREQLEMSNEDLNNILARQEERREANLAAVASIEAELKSKSASRDALTQKIEKLVADQASVQATINQLQAERGDLKQDLSRLADLVEAKIEQLTEVLSDDLAAIKEDFALTDAKNVQPQVPAASAD